MFVLKIDVILVLVVRLLGYELTIYLVVREITVMLDPFLIKIKIIIIIIVNINKKKKNMIIIIIKRTYYTQFREITFTARKTRSPVIFNITLNTIHTSVTCTASCFLEKVFQVRHLGCRTFQDCKKKKIIK